MDRDAAVLPPTAGAQRAGADTPFPLDMPTMVASRVKLCAPSHVLAADECLEFCDGVSTGAAK